MVFKLFKYFKKYKKDAILAIIFIFLESILEIVVPFLSSLLIDNGLLTNSSEQIIGYDLNYIYLIGGSMVVCALFAFLFGLLFAKYVGIAGNGLAAELRLAQYKKIQEYSLNNVSKYRTNSLITRLTSDITTIQTTITQGYRPALRAPIMMASSIILSFIMSWQLAIIFVIVIPFLAFLLFLILRKVTPIFTKIQKIFDKVNRSVQENIIGIKTIKSYVRKDYQVSKYEEINTELYVTAKKGFGFVALNAPIMQLVIYLTITLILYFGGSLHSVGGIKVGTLTSFLSYVLQLLNTLMMLSSVFMMISRSNASAIRVNEILNEKVDIVDNKNSTLKLTNGDIEFKNVYFSYNKNSKNYILSDLNFKIKSGETIAIVGQTGSGKSSLINLLMRFFDISGGEILISDHNIKDYSLFNLRQDVSLVPQNNVLFKGSIKDNVLWGKLDSTLDEINEALKLSCSYNFVYNDLKNGIDSEVGQTGSNLSGGQRQRICLARALIRKPKILILDDVTSALDRATEFEIINNLKTKLKDATKIIISQKITSVKNADKIIVLDNGHISNIGNHEYLINHDPIYKDMYELQKKAGV